MKFIVAIDGSNLLEGGGITHIVELLRAADPQRHGFSRILIWGFPNTLEQIENRPWLHKISLDIILACPVRRGYWQRYILPKEVENKNCSILFAPGGSVTCDFNPVVTMSRNMLPFDSKETARYGLSKKRLRYYLLRKIQSRSFKRADGVIFLTDYARENVLQRIGKVKGKIATIPHGISSNFSVKEREIRSISDCTHYPFRLLYVSHASPYKHQWHVIDSVAALRRRTGWNLQLDMIGPRSVQSSSDRIKLAIQKNDPEQEWAYFHGPQSKVVVQEFLANADMGIFASSCENMPNILMEKMKAGLPTASSDRGPMPECLGDAGLYFDPESPESITKTVQEMVENPNLRHEFSQRSVANANGFTWLRCADSTFEFLRQIALEPDHSLNY